MKFSIEYDEERAIGISFQPQFGKLQRDNVFLYTQAELDPKIRAILGLFKQGKLHIPGWDMDYREDFYYILGQEIWQNKYLPKTGPTIQQAAAIVQQAQKEFDAIVNRYEEHLAFSQAKSEENKTSAP